MPKPKEGNKFVHPQTVLKGQTIRSRDSKTDEVVRSVTVFINLANGWVEQYKDGEQVELVPAERVEFPDELISETTSGKAGN
jgi:hypothetical protein